jgi:hypothetical protein
LTTTPHQLVRKMNTALFGIELLLLGLGLARIMHKDAN